MGSTVSLAEYRKMQIAGTTKGKGVKNKKKKVITVTGKILMNDQKIVFEWEGIDVSLNEWYSGKHWTAKNKEIQYWHGFFKSYLVKPYPLFLQYDISIEYNSNLDPSNCITMIKLFEDVMQKEKIIPNDNKKCCKGIKLFPNLEMGKKHYKITVNAK